MIFQCKEGRKLSQQRWFNASPAVLDNYRDTVIGPALAEFQTDHGTIELINLGNLDESMIDLCDYAVSGGKYWFMAGFGNSVLVPYEQSPHFTLILGFVGRGDR